MSKSNLDYPISILIAEGGKISTPLSKDYDYKDDFNKAVAKTKKLASITRAINILSVEKKKEEKERERKEKLDIIDF